MSVDSRPSAAVGDPEAALAARRRRYGLGTVFLLLAICGFLVVKIVFRLPGSSNSLYAYGVAVTAVVALQVFVAFVLYRDAAVQPPKSASQGAVDRPFVSAIVAVHNDEDIIAACTASMLAQTYSPMEVIVVDDASTDGTAEVLRQIEAQGRIRVITMAQNVGKKRALSAAVLAAKGDVYAFTDSDSTWAPDAIERCIKVMTADPRIGAVSGHCRARNANTTMLARIQDSWYEGQFSVRKAFESYFGAVSCISGPLAVFRKDAVFNYMPAWAEDQFLGDEFRFATDRMLTGFVLMNSKRAAKVRAKSAGTEFASPVYPHQKWRAEYCKSAKSLTEVPDNFRSMIRQQVRWKKSFIRNMFFTGAFYWRRPLPVSLVYYLHILFVWAGPFIAFRHLIYLPLHGSIESAVLYLAGIMLIGTIFGFAFRLEDPEHADEWWCRPLMSLLSTLVLSWLLVYSTFTIKKMTWSRG